MGYHVAANLGDAPELEVRLHRAVDSTTVFRNRLELSPLDENVSAESRSRLLDIACIGVRVSRKARSPDLRDLFGPRGADEHSTSTEAFAY